jgi:hypothetical protein
LLSLAMGMGVAVPECNLGFGNFAAFFISPG